MASSSKSDSDWASLPKDVIDEILDNLVSTEDFLGLSEVCVQWQHAVSEKIEDLRSNHKRHCRLHQQVPLLVVPSRDNAGGRYCLFDVLQGKVVFEFELGLGQGSWRIEGSSHGWLIVFGMDSCKVNLLNPFSGEIIHLPPIQNSQYVLTMGPVNFLVTPWKRRRCVLSKDIHDDVNRDDVVLMMTCKASEQKIAFIKLGEKSWTYVEELRDVEDIACINDGGGGGGGLLYLIDKFGVPFSCHVKHKYNNNNEATKLRLRWISAHNDDGCESDGVYLVQYLVESPEGDLLWVVRNNKNGLVKIRKLIWFSNNPRWEEVTDLGDVALFLGDGCSTSVTASDFPGCRPNSIYFCQSLYRVALINASVHVFSLTDRTCTPLYWHFREHVHWISPRFV